MKIGEYCEDKCRRVVLLCGMISSGKSSLTKQLATHGFIAVNDDSIVSAIHGGDYSGYREHLKLLYKSTENHIIQAGLMLNRPVVVDRGVNIGINARRRLVAMAHSLDVDAEAIVFPNEGPEIHANRRHASDSRGYDFSYWLDVALSHNRRWATPTPEEGFSRILKYDFSSNSLDAVNRF